MILEKRYIMLWRKHSAVALLVQSSKSTPLLQKALPPGWKCHCWNQFFPAKEKKMRDLSPKVVLRCSLSKFGINTLQQCGNNTLVLLDMPPCKWTFQTIMNGSSANSLRTFSKRNQSFYFFIYWYLVLDMDIGIWYLTWIFLRIWPGYPDDQSESQRGDKGSA